MDGVRRIQKSAARLNNLARRADTAADVEPGNLGRAELDKLEIALLSAAQRGDVRRISADDVDLYPIIPFDGGGHLHLDGGARETCDCDITDWLLLDHGWEIPAPDWTLIDADPPAVLCQFPQTFFEAIARHLWGTSKDADFLASPTSNAGKSTLASALSAALPGAVAVKQAPAVLTAQRRKFSAHVAPLEHSRIVLYDECGKVDDWTGVIFELTPADLDIEHKGMDTVTRRRFGNAVFLGDAPPALDSSIQGVEERIGYTADLTLPAIDAETRRLWLSETEIARLRAWMLDFALDATQAARDRNYHRNADRVTTLDAMRPADVDFMRDTFRPGSSYTNEVLRDKLTGAGFDAPNNKRWQPFILRCWPKATKASVKAGDSSKRGWYIPNP